MLAALLLRTKPSLMFLQYPNDLFFAETASLHTLPPQLENRLTINTGHFRVAGQQAYLESVREQFDISTNIMMIAHVIVHNRP